MKGTKRRREEEKRSPAVTAHERPRKSDRRYGPMNREESIERHPKLTGRYGPMYR
jgi:hypothetical protein